MKNILFSKIITITLSKFEYKWQSNFERSVDFFFESYISTILLIDAIILMVHVDVSITDWEVNTFRIIRGQKVDQEKTFRVIWATTNYGTTHYWWVSFGQLSCLARIENSTKSLLTKKEVYARWNDPCDKVAQKMKKE